MFIYRFWSLVIYFPFCLTILFAQSPKNSPVKWGVVSELERSMAQCYFEPEASAIVLHDFGEWKLKSAGKALGYKGILQRHIRIKILNEAGLEWAEGSLNYVHAEKFENISGFKAQTINWDGENYIYHYHPLKDENIIKEKLDDYHTKLNYAFPQVKVGSIIELTYQLMTSDIMRLKPWHFQKEIPTLHSELIKGKNKFIDHVVIEYHVEDEAPKENHWVMKNIPSLIEEPFVNNIEHYRTRIEFEIKDYQKAFHSSYGTYVYKADFYKTWGDLNRDLSPPLLNFDGNDKKIANLRNLVDSLVAETPDTLERLKLLYNFVRDSIEWNEEYAIKTNRGQMLTTLEDGKGNSAEINGLLKKMLEFGGIRCAPMVLGTIRHRPPVLEYPIVSQFNQRIVVAQVGPEIYFLNATDPFRPYYLPDANDLVSVGWLLQLLGGGGWISIPNNKVARHQVYASLELKDEEMITANVSSSFAGYYGVDMRHILEEVEEKTFWEEIIRKGVEATDISHQEIENLKDVDQPLKLSYEFTAAGFVQVSGDYMYINPLAIFEEDKNPFLSPKRKYNIDMGYLHQKNLTITFSIPDGYELESMPEPLKISLDERAMTYLFSCEKLGSQLQITSRFETKTATFAPEAYPALKKLYDRMLGKYGEQIVLKRK